MEKTMRLTPAALAFAILFLSFAPGCASNGLKSVPGDAMLVQEGGSAFTYTATDPGTVYVRDQGADRIIYSGRMSPGDQLQVDSNAQRVTVAGRTVKTPALRPDASYQVFFLKGEHREYHPMMNP